MKVHVTDQQYKTYVKQDEATVRINVNRNRLRPYFVNTPYQTTTSENTLVTTSIFVVSAKDDDMQGSSLKYEIVGSNSAPYFFFISSTNGTIYVQNNLRSERTVFTYRLTVQAYDILYPEDRATTDVTINIRRNENPPQFDQFQYTANISENTALGVLVLKLNATDRDGDSVRYERPSQSALFDEYFYLDPSTGYISVKKDLTQDNAVTYNVFVRAVDNGVPPQSNQVSVIISVYRDTSNPAFNVPFIRETINENTPVGASIAKVVATDADRVGVITYEVTGNYPAPSLFSVHPTNGDVTVVKDLRFEAIRTNSIYNLIVTAYDSFRPNNRGTATVEITVLRNPSTPSWGLPLYTVTIREDHPPNSEVIPVSATDADPKDVITYDIVNEVDERALSTGPSHYFYIDTETGAISLRRSLLNTPYTRFTLTVEACDNGVPQKCMNTTVVVNISEDKNAPNFIQTPYQRTILETYVVGQQVLVVTAVDSNTLGSIRYQIESPMSPYFAIDENTGNITVAKNLMTSLETTFQFKVSTYDSGEPQYKNTADVEITVVRNPSAPVFVPNFYNVTVDQNEDYGYIVVNTTANDLDGDILRYSISGTSEALSYFNIRPDNGIVYLQKLLTNPSRSSYQLNVLARDQRIVNERSGNAVVNIIIDFDESPRFIGAPFGRGILESQAVDSVITQTRAQDPDLKGTLVYESIGLYPAQDYFAVNSTTGFVTLIRDLKRDSENLQTYTLRVVAYDSLYPNLRATTDVVINVGRNPNGPIFVPQADYSTSVQENVTIGIQVLNITATDRDSDTITYTISSSNPVGGGDYFYLNPDTGILSTKRALTAAPVNFYTLTIQASDGRGQTTSAQARITIIRIPSDQRPFFIGAPYNNSITFRQAINSVIVDANANDPDLRGQLQYEIVGIYPAQDFFSIDRSTGVVTLTRDLATDSFETLQYVLRLEVYDSTNPDLRGVANSYISVTRNPAPPQFTSSSYSIGIDETYRVGGLVISVNATDADGDTVLYSIVQNVNGLSASEYFFLNGETGGIFVLKDLRLTPNSIFQFTVRARDQGRPEKYADASVTISITRDTADPSFQIKNYFVEVLETEPVNSLNPFQRIQATDNNLRGSIIYEEVGDGLAMAYFNLNRNNGGITVQKSLLTTNQTNFQLQVRAYDSFYPDNTDNATVSIRVRRNPNAPQFSQSVYRQTINEYHPFGLSVITVSAGDADKDVVSFAIDPPSEYFYIERYSGRIYIRRSPSTNPSVSLYNLTITASDQRTPPEIRIATVLISIATNQRPVFINLPTTISVQENVAAGASVFRVDARDQDMLQTSRLLYTVIGDGSGPSFFSLNDTTGIISARPGILKDTNQQYLLRISVYDENIPELPTTSTLTILMTRNLNSPIFTQRRYVFNITDKYVPSQPVGSVVANDQDNDKLTYSLTGSIIGQQYFYLNPENGQIILIKSLDTTSDRSFTLDVSVTDNRVPEKTDSVQVTINVDRDVKFPQFDRTYLVNINENTPVNSTIETVRATDEDLRGRIQYEVIGIYPAPSFFNVDKDNGNIRIIQDLKNDNSPNPTTIYILKVSAYDSADPSRTSTTDVTINVARNVFGPVFIENPYRRTVSELHQLAVPIANISATDADRDSVAYRLVRDSTGGASLVFFYIDAQGYLFLRRPLTESTASEFRMIVAATDSGNPSKTVEVEVIVQVVRISAPTFLRTPYATTLLENTNNGTSIYNVETDKPRNNMVYELIGQPPAPYYFRVQQNGDIVVVNDLKNDKTMVYTVTVRGYERNTPSKYTDVNLVINMLRNQNPPVFSPPKNYAVTVAYDDPLGKEVYRFQATDNDGDVLQYTLTGDARCQQVFYVIGGTGQVILNRDLRTTSDLQFNCQVRATDNGYPTANTDSATLVVSVIRGTSPVFNNQDSTFTLRENDPVTTRVGNPVTATRSPMPTNPYQIVYEIVGQYPAQSFFGVSNTTGQISIIQDLRRDGLGRTQYKVLVVAYGTDKPDLRSTATVTVNVQRNLNGPRFFPQSDTIELPETTDVNFWSMQQNVTDPDSVKVRCSIISNQKAQEFFKVDPDTCLLSLKKSLKDDPELTTTYTVVIQATDDGQPPNSNSKTIIVNVPRDLGPPTFNNLPRTITIPETQPMSSSIFTVAARDSLRGKLQYSIVGNFPAQTFFQIDPLTGNITVRNVPKSDGLETPQYIVRVKVIDDAWPNNPQYGDLTVNIDRNPSGPSLQQTAYTVTIRADNPVGATVVNIAATDNDGDKLLFTSRGTQGDKAYFYVNPESGAIIQVGDLTKAPQTVYQFNVDVSDSRQPVKTVTAQITINVVPLRGPPRFDLSDYVVNVPIITPVNNSIQQVRARDEDLQGNLVYNVIGFAPGTDYFFMQQSNNIASIRVRQSLLNNPNINPTYVLLLEAYDDKSPEDKSYATVTINVNRNMNPPIFIPNILTATSNDYDPIGTNVIDVDATDADVTTPERTLIYAIEDGRDATNYFAIDPFSGLITIKKRLSEDTARPPFYVLRILARDSSSAPQTATATVTVNVNRNTAPAFINPASYSFSPSEAVNVYDTIFTVQARDNDDSTLQNGKIEYYFEGPPAASRVFGINPTSGAIYPRISLREVTQDTWQFQVGVRDLGVPSLFTTATVTANIQRIGLPTFPLSQYDITKFESEPVDSVIITVTATDPLPGGTLVYEIRGDGLAGEYFRIINNNGAGEIRLNKSFSLDDNKTPTYKIRVYAYRPSNPQEYAETFVNVLVIRNPNEPQFQHGNLQVTINENTPLATSIISVNATDGDPGDNGVIVYSFSSQESQPVYATNYFYVNPTNGDITVTANLRGDPNTPRYTLRVIARDRGVPSKQSGVTVTVNIERNPHAPQFIQRNYEITVNESIPVGNSVIKVDAVDQDLDPIVYSITYNPPASLYFAIDGGSGLIRTATNLYQDEATRYVLIVTAQDQTSSPLTGTTTVTVRVNRNVNGPVFANPSYEKTISEYTDINTVVEQVIATDIDSDQSSSGVLRYSIRRTEPISANPYFIISPTSGEIHLAQALTNNRTANQYKIYVMAKDVSDTPKNATTIVTVNIVRNIHSPVFTQTLYTANASDLMRNSETVTQVTATDEDINNIYNKDTPNARIAYSLPGDATTFRRYFVITPDGVLKVAQPLPTLTNINTMNIKVQACDLGWNPKCSQSDVQIALSHREIQEGKLGFKQPVYYKDVPENTVRNTILVPMDVENQGEQEVECEIISTDSLPLFTIEKDEFNKNCRLVLNGDLDYESRRQYNVTVRVEAARTNTGRRKRQIYIYNTHPIASVIVQVVDINDNAPLFRFPVYPRQNSDTNKKYFGAISSESRPSRSVMDILATDADSGNNGRVTYSIRDGTQNPVNPPFEVSPDEGVISTTQELQGMASPDKQYRFGVQATDNPLLAVDRQFDDADAIINLIYPHHRFVLVLDNKQPDEVLAIKEKVRLGLQTVTSKVALIEAIERKRFENINNNNIEIDNTDSDVYFVLQEPFEPFNLINNTERTNLFTNSKLADLSNILQTDASLKVIMIRDPYTSDQLTQTRLSKSYVWWLDDPWAALVALAAISILLCLIGLIVLIFTHSRYIKYINSYRIYQQSYDQPEFVEPPSFLREYETQSLNMYVPPDEAVQELGEINMTFEGENVVAAEHIGGDQGITSAVNPIYQEDDNQGQQQAMGFSESTTML